MLLLCGRRNGARSLYAPMGEARSSSGANIKLAIADSFAATPSASGARTLFPDVMRQRGRFTKTLGVHAIARPRTMRAFCGCHDSRHEQHGFVACRLFNASHGGGCQRRAHRGRCGTRSCQQQRGDQTAARGRHGGCRGVSGVASGGACCRVPPRTSRAVGAPMLNSTTASVASGHNLVPEESAPPVPRRAASRLHRGPRPWRALAACCSPRWLRQRARRRRQPTWPSLAGHSDFCRPTPTRTPST